MIQKEAYHRPVERIGVKVHYSYSAKGDKGNYLTDDNQTEHSLWNLCAAEEHGTEEEYQKTLDKVVDEKGGIHSRAVHTETGKEGGIGDTEYLSSGCWVEKALKGVNSSKYARSGDRDDYDRNENH